MDMNEKLKELGESMVNKTSYQFIQRKPIVNKRITLPKKILVAAVIVVLLLSILVVAATPLQEIFSNTFVSIFSSF